jgi:hypothetical protein
VIAVKIGTKHFLNRQKKRLEKGLERYITSSMLIKLLMPPVTKTLDWTTKAKLPMMEQME